MKKLVLLPLFIALTVSGTAFANDGIFFFGPFSLAKNNTAELKFFISPSTVNRPCNGVTAVFRDSEGFEVTRDSFDVSADNAVKSFSLAARDIFTRRQRRIILTVEMVPPDPVTPSCARLKALLEVLNSRGVPVLVFPPNPILPPTPI